MATKKQIEDVLWKCVQGTHAYKLYELFEKRYGSGDDNTEIPKKEIDCFFNTCMLVAEKISEIKDEYSLKNDLTSKQK